MRIDKWLWAARFFKTRALAIKACDLGRVQWNGQTAKPAREVRVGDKLHIKTEAGEYDVEVLGLSEMRGPAAVAQTLYVESPESQERRRLAIEAKKAMPFYPEGKPSKKDRRKIIWFQGRD
jgi:ribosome-associated heat shock protein Hsp15